MSDHIRLGFSTTLTRSRLSMKIKAMASISGIAALAKEKVDDCAVCIITAFTTALLLLFDGRTYVYIFIVAGFMLFLPLFLLLRDLLVA